MRLLTASVLSAGLALQGCVAFPELPSGHKINVRQIIDNVECELKHSLLDNVAEHYWLLGWAATIIINLETYNTGAGSGEVTLSVPVSAQTLGLTLSTGPTRLYNSVGTFGYSVYLIDIVDRTCPAEAPAKTDSLLTGRTGAGDWLTRVARDASQKNICPNAIDFGLEFVLSIDGEGNPTITGIGVGSGSIDADIDLIGSRTNDHELTLSAVPVGRVYSAPDAKKVNRVLARAANRVRETTGEWVSKQDFLACAPLGSIVVADRREVVDNQTMQALQTAVGGSLVRSIDGDPVSASD